MTTFELLCPWCQSYFTIEIPSSAHAQEFQGTEEDVCRVCWHPLHLIWREAGNLYPPHRSEAIRVAIRDLLQKEGR